MISVADLFNLAKYKLRIESLEGFGEKSYQNLNNAIEKARHTTAVRFLYSLGIPNIGLANAKLIVANYKGDISAILNATKEELVMIDGIGDIMAEGYVAYMKNEANLKVIKDLLMVLDLEVYQASTKEQILEGITFCITGAVHYYANRDVFKEVVESLGGKVYIIAPYQNILKNMKIKI